MDEQPTGVEKPKRERDPFLDDIGDRIKLARTQAKLTQRELGALVKTGQCSIFLAEDGQLNLQIHTLRKIAEALHVSLHSLLPGASDPVMMPDDTNQTVEIIQDAIADTTQLLGKLHNAAILAKGRTPRK